MKKTFLLLLFIQNLYAETIYITGSIESKNTQHILMPLVPSFQGKISEMVDEGTMVKAGDFILRIDGSSIDSQIDSQVESLEVFKSTALKDSINLEIELNNAQIAFDSAEINLEIATLDSKTPLEFIGELAFKQNQLGLKNAEKLFEQTKNNLNEVKIKIKSKQQEIKLGLKQKQDKLDYLNETLNLFTIHAKQDGFIIYSNNWRGEKVQVGDQLNSGQEVLSVSQNADLQIAAWINAIDLPKVKKDQEVEIKFDAFLESQFRGTISEISSGGEDKQVWGDSLYYKAIVEFKEQPTLDLMLGMSALIEINNGNNHE